MNVNVVDKGIVVEQFQTTSQKAKSDKSKEKINRKATNTFAVLGKVLVVVALTVVFTPFVELLSPVFAIALAYKILFPDKNEDPKVRSAPNVSKTDVKQEKKDR